MPWWPRLLPLVLLVLLPGAVLLMPLRIFVRYLRENRTDHISLQLKLGPVGICFEQRDNASGERRVTRCLLVGRIRPAGFRQRALEPEPGSGGEGVLGKIFLPGGLAGFLKAGRRLRGLLKKVTWSRFELEFAWGGDDPAWTALAAGAAWTLGGTVIGLLYRYFSVTARPRISVLPAWEPAGLRLRWEGEASLSVYNCLQLWRVIKKQEG